MKVTFVIPLLTASMLLAPAPLAARSKPIIRGDVAGLELLPQSIFGSALFVGIFQGRLGQDAHALGAFAVAVQHEDLPEAGEAAEITGGQWQIRTAGKSVSGVVVEGILFNNGDNTFQVVAALRLIDGGRGVIYFSGLLDHNVFPPTVQGQITQWPP